MNGVRSFLKGRKFPGTVHLSRTERTPQPGAPAPDQRATLGSPSAQTAVSSADVPQTPASTGPDAPPVAVDGQQQPSGASPADSGASEGREPLGNAASNAQGPAEVARTYSTMNSMTDTRIKKFQKCLGEQVVDLDALRELAWSGIPANMRPSCWQLLLGYLPPNRDRRDPILARKRQEYKNMVPEYYDCAAAQRSEEDNSALRQVLLDVPRTAPGVAFFHQPRIQKSLERILYIWGIRHPASGYVQGINDLVTPFLAVFLSSHFQGPMEEWSMDTLPEERMIEVEADSYWCLCKLLDGIQDHYTYAQPGIQRTVFHIKELVRRIDEPVAQHLDDEGLEFLQFTFRWVNCLLLREVPFPLAIRLWDTYLAEGPHMREFLMYVLASFLLNWTADLRKMEFQDLIMFLQKLPTQDWSEKDVEIVLSRAYMWRASFDDARSHLNQQ